jgi:membrane protease YdiL (CAAX protease family)
MSRADGTPRPHSLAGWLVSLLIFAAAVVYVSAFWGQPYGWLSQMLPRHLGMLVAAVQLCLRDAYHFLFRYYLLHEFAIGVIPAVLVMLCRRRPGDLGLGMFNALGFRLILVSVALSIPFGFLLIHTGAVPIPKSFSHAMPLLRLLLIVVPEHMLICGLFVALMLPDRRFPRTVPLASAQGPWYLRILRWLGLAQPVGGKAGGAVLGWFGLTAESLVAVLTSGLLFGMAHLGKKDIVEIALSLPGGVAVAYMTLRSRSIWPAIIAHVTMNVIPVGIAVLWR